MILKFENLTGSLIIALIVCVLLLSKANTASAQDNPANNEIAEKTQPAASEKVLEPKTINDLYYKNIIPGITSEKDALKIMGGKFEKKRENEDKTISYIFDSKVPGYPNEFTVDSIGKVIHAAIVPAPGEKLNISAVEKILGKPDRHGFSHYAFFLRVHVFAKSGMVFICNETGDVHETQYFEKCDLPAFEKKFGKNFPEKSPYKY
ncbi:MAG: hypothetical protein QMC67_02825 [Candidatus Wallbacteria bacterium]